MRYIFIVFLLIGLASRAQFYRQEFTEAKRQFKLGNYKAAREGFSELTQHKDFGPYASFYYALCSREVGDTKTASAMWKQILKKYPAWDKSEDVKLWLSYSAFESRNYREGFRYADRLSGELRTQVIHTFFSSYSIEELQGALAEYPEKEVAKYLLLKMNEVSYDERDQQKLIDFADKYGLSSSDAMDMEVVLKDRYAVAVVLPFMYSGLAKPQTVLKNTIIYNLYQGMEFGNAQLDSLGIRLDIFPFDTKKSGEVTTGLIQNNNLQNADVIIGPLYAEPSEVLRSFSYQNQIPMINPLSSNEKVIGDNPYAFLFNSTYSTKGRKAATYAAEKFQDNKDMCIFFETPRDQIVAEAYKVAIEEKGFNVLRFDEITNKSAQQIQQRFTEQYEFIYDTLVFSKEQILDSIGSLPGRFIRTRSIRDEVSGKPLKDAEDNELPEYYEMKFKIKPDSIGHIFVASSSNVLANNFISLVEVRADGIGLIGYDDWLNFSLVNYEQLERIGVSLIGSNFFDITTPDFQRMKKKFINQMGQKPNEYHLIGYELVMQLGRLFAKYGSNFQLGLQNEPFIPGILMQGIQYESYNDNQIVPILQLEGLKLVNRSTSQ